MLKCPSEQGYALSGRVKWSCLALDNAMLTTLPDLDLDLDHYTQTRSRTLQADTQVKLMQAQAARKVGLRMPLMQETISCARCLPYPA